MFLTTTGDWAVRGAAIVAAVTDRFGPQGLAADRFGLVLVQPGAGGRPEGFAHRGDWRVYPCSLVKSFHLLHGLAALEQGRIGPDAEFDRAMADMIAWSSNTATNYVIDILTGTTGDTRLEGAALAGWIDRREGLNRFFAALGWAEFAGCTITQKLMDDVRYGREAQYAGPDGANLNALTPLAAARLLWALFQGGLPLSDQGRARAQHLLRRDRAGADAADPRYQIAGYLGGALPEGVEIWSKAGHNLWTGDPRASWFKHDMIRMAAPGRTPLIAVLMTQGRAISETHPDLFPQIGRLICEMTAPKTARRTADAG